MSQGRLHDLFRKFQEKQGRKGANHDAGPFDQVSNFLEKSIVLHQQSLPLSRGVLSSFLSSEMEKIAKTISAFDRIDQNIGRSKHVHVIRSVRDLNRCWSEESMTTGMPS